MEAMGKAYTVAFITSGYAGSLGHPADFCHLLLVRSAPLTRRKEQWLQCSGGSWFGSDREQALRARAIIFFR